MPVVINGTTGISGTDGSASTPALRGSDTNTGVFYGTDVVSIATNGTERAQVDSSGNLKLSTAATKILNSSGNPILQQTGSVLQVVSASNSTAFTSTTDIYADTGLSASITPTSSTSKIIIMVNHNAAVTRVTTGTTAYGGIQLLRDSTVILRPQQDGATTAPFEFSIVAGGNGANGIGNYGRYAITWLDSPSTTSSVTYKTQGAANGTSFSFKINLTGTGSNASSSIILMEIAA